MRSIESPSLRYRNFVEDRVQEAQIFDRGRSLVTVKALVADQNLQEAQLQLTPGFSFPFNPQQDQVLVALDMTTWERFSKSDLKFALNGVPSAKVHEITNPIEVETHYPFAHPHFRIFMVSFERAPQSDSKEWELWVKTLRGDLRLRFPSEASSRP